MTNFPTNKLPVLLIAIVSFAAIQSQTVHKPAGCGPRCAHVRCAPQKIENCTTGEALVPRDGDCMCCDRCLKLEHEDCDPERCALVDCNPRITVDYCFERKMAFARRDAQCVCCDMCVVLANKAE